VSRHRLSFGNLPLHQRFVPWRRKHAGADNHAEAYAQATRQFFLGSALALAAVLLALPAYFFLIHRPSFAYARAVEVLVLLLLLIAAAMGAGKLLRCMLSRSFDVLTAVSLGVLLIFVVLLVYAGVFLFVMK